MPSVFTQMDRDPVSPGRLSRERSLQRVRIVRAPRLTERRHMIDVDVEPYHHVRTVAQPTDGFQPSSLGRSGLHELTQRDTRRDLLIAKARAERLQRGAGRHLVRYRLTTFLIGDEV